MDPKKDLGPLKPCPFCGRTPEIDHPDTLYPNGVGWRQEKEGFRSYHNRRDIPKEQWCYSLHCDESCGGCGAEISADSQEEAVEKWNRRTQPGT